MQVDPSVPTSVFQFCVPQLYAILASVAQFLVSVYMGDPCMTSEHTCLAVMRIYRLHSIRFHFLDTAHYMGEIEVMQICGLCSLRLQFWRRRDHANAANCIHLPEDVLRALGPLSASVKYSFQTVCSSLQMTAWNITRTRRRIKAFLRRSAV